MAVEIMQFLLAAQPADTKPLESRRLAGIVLKNSLDAEDATTKEHLVQQWMSNDASFGSQVKGLLLNTLGSSVLEAGHTAAQLIAKIASIEIPRKEWPELIASLLGNMIQQDKPASLKQATLEALGYVCEEISHNDLVQDEVNSVLTAVVQGMNVTEQSSIYYSG
ncbi:putative armadillo-like helical, importin beta family [Helianthus annuus]|nr:putative armadillo-like helical, importin beta family [Helianthus annuus]